METPTTPELTLEAPPEIMESLISFLPRYGVAVRFEKSITSTYVRSIAEGMIRTALEQGYFIDRSNGDGPLAEWDGWFVLHTPKVRTFIQTTWRIGEDG